MKCEHGKNLRIETNTVPDSGMFLLTKENLDLFGQNLFEKARGLKSEHDSETNTESFLGYFERDNAKMMFCFENGQLQAMIGTYLDGMIKKGRIIDGKKVPCDVYYYVVTNYIKRAGVDMKYPLQVALAMLESLSGQCVFLEAEVDPEGDKHDSIKRLYRNASLYEHDNLLPLSEGNTILFGPRDEVVKKLERLLGFLN